MYESFYGLSSKPFQLIPDPQFYYGSKQHNRAKAYLEYGVSRNEGFVVVTGEIGAGKTTMLRKLIESLHGTNVVTGHLVTTQLGAEDALRMVGAAFGIRVKDVAKSDLLITLEAFLVSQTSEGKRCLLLVDEAQNLSLRAVEELRMLSNLQFNNHALLQTFLIGQPEFRRMLRRPELEQLRQRVSASCHIGPLDVDETQAYIEHRLKQAGAAPGSVMAEDCFAPIFQATQGIPRRINSLCDRILLMGFLVGRDRLTAIDVREVIRELEQESQPSFEAGGATTGLGDPGLSSGFRPSGLQTGGYNTSAFAPLRDSISGGLTQPVDIDLGPSGSSNDPALMLQRERDRLDAGQQGDQLQRIERSMLRLERSNLQLLAVVQMLMKNRESAGVVARSRTDPLTRAEVMPNAAAGVAPQAAFGLAGSTPSGLSRLDPAAEAGPSATSAPAQPSGAVVKFESVNKGGGTAVSSGPRINLAGPNGQDRKLM